MNFFSPKIFPTKTGQLYFSPCPNGKNDLEVLKNLQLDCIYNLAKEFEYVVDLEKAVCPKVIFGNIEDFSVPTDFYKFVGQVYEVASMLMDGKKVLVHCMAGRGRTSLVLCCISVLLKEGNIEEIFTNTKKIANGPEREKQKDFVRYFANFISRFYNNL